MDNKLHSIGKADTKTQPSGSKYLNWRGWSLQLQLLTVVTIIVLTVVFSITVASILRESRSFRTELEERAITTIDSLDAATIDLLYFANVSIHKKKKFFYF